VNDKLSHGGWIAGGIAWYLAHIEVINGVLQTAVLLGTLIGIYFAARYHNRNTHK
jgi:hypothetical protein